MTTRSVIVALVALLVLSGCASTGVVPVGDGVYMISKQSAAGIFGTPAGVEAIFTVRPTHFVRHENQVLQTVDVQTQNAVPFAHEGSATLHFRCVPPK